MYDYCVVSPNIMGNRALADNQVASIALPPNLFQEITDRTQVGVFFGLYNESTLFPVRTREDVASAVPDRTTIVGSPIIAATVGPGLSFNNLQPPVEVNLRIPTEINGSVSLELNNCLKIYIHLHSLRCTVQLLTECVGQPKFRI